MSNLGLERFLSGQGMALERTKVGDRYVLERMREGGFNVGGEQSGHMILSDYATTGDGTVAALQVLAALVRSGKPASERSEEHTSELQSLMRTSYAVFCLKKKTTSNNHTPYTQTKARNKVDESTMNTHNRTSHLSTAITMTPIERRLLT